MAKKNSHVHGGGPDDTPVVVGPGGGRIRPVGPGSKGRLVDGGGGDDSPIVIGPGPGTGVGESTLKAISIVSPRGWKHHPKKNTFTTVAKKGHNSG